MQLVRSKVQEETNQDPPSADRHCAAYAVQVSTNYACLGNMELYSAQLDRQCKPRFYGNNLPITPSNKTYSAALIATSFSECYHLLLLLEDRLDICCTEIVHVSNQ